MARKETKVAPAPVQIQPLLIVSGQFFVFTIKKVQVHVLDAMATALLYDGLSIADTRSFNQEFHRDYVVRQTFGREAIGFLPAGTAEALWYYAEHYEGMLAEQVKGLAACILSGTPYGPESHMGGGIVGGEKVTPPVRPNAPKDSGGAGAAPTFREQAESDMRSRKNAKLMEAYS